VSLKRTLKVLGKDFRLGPRSPIFMWVLFLPVFLTLVLQVVFGSLFEPEPRMGIVDFGDSQITAAFGRIEGIQLALLGDVAGLKAKVEANDLDAGLVLPVGFDDSVRAGVQPPLELYVGGESLASNRTILVATTLELIRDVEGSAPPVEVEIVALGKEALPISLRLVPLIVMYALVVAAVFLPAFSIADEREKGTLAALTVTPVRLSEVVTAKGMLGFVLAFAMAVFTLWLNSALGAQALALVVVLAVAAALCAEIGLIFGAAAKDVNGVFALIKGTGVLLIGPTIFYLFPDWPQWVAKLFPTYWIINPLFEVTIDNSGLGEVWQQVLIAVGIVALLAAPVMLLTRRLRGILAMA